MQNAADNLELYDFSVPAKLLHSVKFPGIGMLASIHGHWNEPEISFGFTSYINPEEHYSFNTDTFE